MNLPPDANFGDKKPRTPAPRIDPVFVWPTPEKRDYLFYVEANGDLPVNKGWQYGDPHPDKTKFPDHKLVYVTPQEPDKWSKWFYASERVLQDAYNWELTNSNVSGVKFDSVTRTYLFLRSEHDALIPRMGAAMPNIPKDKFNTEFVLAERQQLESPEIEVRSLFVLETRTYIKRCSITMIQTDDFFGIGGSKVDNLYYRGEVIDSSAVEVHFATPNSSYWGWQEDGSIRDGKQLSETWFLISIINSITDTIDSYSFSYPSFTNLNLPRRLTGSEVTFNTARGVGNQDQDGWVYETGSSVTPSLGLADSCSSSISVSPEIGLTFFEPNGSFTPCVVYSFFLPRPATLASIIARVSALHGAAVTPYEPPDTVTELITLISAAASVRCTATAAASFKLTPSTNGASMEKSTSTDKSVSQTTQFLQIAGVVNESPSFNESQTESVEATASINVYGSGGATGLNASAFVEDSVEVTASVQTARSVGRTPGNPGSSNGSFITKINVEQYLFSRAKIFVEVVTLD